MKNIIIFLIMFVFFSLFGVISGILSEMKRICFQKKYRLTLREKIILIKNILTYDYFVEFTKPYYLSNINKIIEKKIDESKIKNETIFFERNFQFKICNPLISLLLNDNLNNYKNIKFYSIITEKKIVGINEKIELNLTETDTTYYTVTKKI